MKRGGPLVRRTRLRAGKPLRGRRDPLKAYCWSLLRALVLHRDGYKCRRCGRGEAAVVLQVSHIKSRGAHPSLAWNVDNCLTLCKKDHLYWWHRDPQKAAAWCAENLAPHILRRLDLATRLNGRRGGGDLKLQRIALEQELQAAGLPLPPAPHYPIPRKAKRRASG